MGYPTKVFNQSPSVTDVSAVAASNTTAPEHGEKCPIKTIPAEIRNYIYELVLQQEKVGATIELKDAQPLSHSLLQTCRQFFREAKLMYDEAYGEFWSTNNFKTSITRFKGSRASSKRKAVAMLERMEERRFRFIKWLQLNRGDWYASRTFGIWFKTRENGEILHRYGHSMLTEAMVARLYDKGIEVSAIDHHDILAESRVFCCNPGDIASERCNVRDALQIANEIILTKHEVIAVVNYLA